MVEAARLAIVPLDWSPEAWLKHLERLAEFQLKVEGKYSKEWGAIYKLGADLLREQMRAVE